MGDCEWVDRICIMHAIIACVIRTLPYLISLRECDGQIGLCVLSHLNYQGRASQTRISQLVSDRPWLLCRSKRQILQEPDLFVSGFCRILGSPYVDP